MQKSYLSVVFLVGVSLLTGCEQEASDSAPGEEGQLSGALDGEECPPYLNATASCWSVSFDCSTAMSDCNKELDRQCNNACSIGCANRSPISCAIYDDATCQCAGSAEYTKLVPVYQCKGEGALCSASWQCCNNDCFAGQCRPQCNDNCYQCGTHTECGTYCGPCPIPPPPPLPIPGPACGQQYWGCGNDLDCCWGLYCNEYYYCEYP